MKSVSLTEPQLNIVPYHTIWVKEKDGKILIMIPRVASESMRFALGWNPEKKVWTEYWKPYMREMEVAYFVRDPFDRLISQYNLFRSSKKKLAIDKDSNFSTFAEYICNTEDKLDRHFWSQTDYLTARDGFIEADFLGRYENLEEDWARFKEWSGWDIADLPHEHKSDVSPLYNLRTLALTEDKFADDFKNFGYE